MDRATKQDWLEGPVDLKQAVIENCPAKGKSVKVQGLSAAYSNDARMHATETKLEADGGGVVVINKTKMEAYELLHGLVEPKLDTLREAEMILERWGPAAVGVIEKIDELSAIDKEEVEKAEARFPGEHGETPAETSENGGDPAPAGDGGPDIPARTGAGDGDADQ